MTAICNAQEISKPLFAKSSLAYTFSLSGSDKEFVLLDVSDNDSSKFFVMCMDTCTNRAFDANKTLKFDVSDSNNLAYYLNNEFLSSGFLPETMVNAVDRGHVWNTEAGPSGSNCTKAYTQTAGVAVLSETELMQYRERIGVIDDFYGRVSAWWLRTGSIYNGLVKVVRPQDNFFDRVVHWDSNQWCGVRPVFWLDRSFFAENAVDFEKTGAGVKRMIYNEYQPGEYGKLYTAEQIGEMEQLAEKPILVNAEFLNNGAKLFSGGEAAAADLYVAAEGGSEAAVLDLYVGCYDREGSLTGVEKKSVALAANTAADFTLSIDKDDWENIRGYLWTAQQTAVSDRIERSAYISSVVAKSSAMGNVYTDAQPAAFEVRAQKGAAVSYIVTDFWGDTAAEGVFTAPSNSFTWTVPKQQYGYFTVELKYRDMPNSSPAKQIFCVLSDEDFTDDEGSFFGVNAHMNWQQYGWKPELINLAAAAGVKSVRVDYSWGGVEKEKGKYTFNNPEYLEYVRQHNMKVNIASGYNNSLYDGGAVPYSDTAAQAFADYQAAVIEHVGSAAAELDVYNEFYGGFGHLYGGGPARSQSGYYMRLLSKTYDTVKARFPQVKVLATATTGSGYCGEENWYENLLKAGAGQKMDGIFPHSYYTTAPPEELVDTTADFYETLNKKYGAETAEVYITETGASTYTGGVTEEEAARRLVRLNVLWMSRGVKKAYWYDLMDDGLSASDRENNFGLLRAWNSSKGAYTPKPAYVALGVMARRLRHAEFTALEKPSDGVYIGRFEKDGKKLAIAWATEDTNVRVAADEWAVGDIMGGEQPVKGEKLLTLSSEPLYLTGECSIIPEN